MAGVRRPAEVLLALELGAERAREALEPELGRLGFGGGIGLDQVTVSLSRMNVVDMFTCHHQATHLPPPPARLPGPPTRAAGRALVVAAGPVVHDSTEPNTQSSVSVSTIHP